MLATINLEARTGGASKKSWTDERSIYLT